VCSPTGPLIYVAARRCPSELTNSVLHMKLVEANMAKTAVGLFKDPVAVDEVVRDLKASGFPQRTSVF